MRSRSPKKRSTGKKQSINHKIMLIRSPKNKSSRLYLVLGKSRDGKFVVQSPKANVKVKDLKKLRPSDFGPTKTLPKGSKRAGTGRKSKRQKSSRRTKRS